MLYLFGEGSMALILYISLYNYPPQTFYFLYGEISSSTTTHIKPLWSARRVESCQPRFAQTCRSLVSRFHPLDFACWQSPSLSSPAVSLCALDGNRLKVRVRFKKVTEYLYNFKFFFYFVLYFFFSAAHSKICYNIIMFKYKSPRIF